MRTCAAHLATASIVANPAAIDDAAALLIAAATEIELLTGPLDLGEPMEIIPPVVTPPPVVAQTSAMWIGDDLKPLPNAPKSRNACPNCDSRAQKTVYREGKQLVLECPVCGSRWRR
jgi:hypothetical protein